MQVHISMYTCNLAMLGYVSQAAQGVRSMFMWSLPTAVLVAGLTAAWTLLLGISQHESFGTNRHVGMQQYQPDVGKTIPSYNLSIGKPWENSGKYWKYHL